MVESSPEPRIRIVTEPQRLLKDIDYTHACSLAEDSRLVHPKQRKDQVKNYTGSFTEHAVPDPQGGLKDQLNNLNV
jgi:hypothetical protein